MVSRVTLSASFPALLFLLIWFIYGNHRLGENKISRKYMTTIPIVINQSHFKSNYPPTYSIDLPKQINNGKGTMELAVANISIYNSTFNISSAIGNNALTLNWLGTSYSITFPDGYYDAEALNYFLQDFCYNNNLYLYNSTLGKNAYYLEITANSVQYKISLNIYPIPTASLASTNGLTKPSGASWSYPSSQTYPQLTFGGTFGNLIGLSGGSYPSSTAGTTNVVFLSTQSPIISPVNSYVFLCNAVFNEYTNPSDFLFAIPINVPLGSMITYINQQLSFFKMQTGSISQITIKIFDQNFKPIQINDTEIVMTLLLRDGEKK